jgi:hypothetical protein
MQLKSERTPVIVWRTDGCNVIFLSWSGERALHMAGLLRASLPHIIQAAEIWCSDEDVLAGTFWDKEIRTKLKAANFAIICVTRENIGSPWMNYEAGAIAERLDGRVVPWMLDVAPTALQSSPLSRLQACSSDLAGTQKLMAAVNRTMTAPLDAPRLTEAVATFWPKLEGPLESIRRKSIAHDELTPQQRFDQIESLLWRVWRRVEFTGRAKTGPRTPPSTSAPPPPPPRTSSVPAPRPSVDMDWEDEDEATNILGHEDGPSIFDPPKR